MNAFSKRAVGLEGVEELLWITEDRGGFEGPRIDWRDDSKSFMEKVRKFETIVQAGGECGMYPLFYSFYFKKVYTFEPDERNYHCLVENCKGQKNVFHARKALSDNMGHATVKPGPRTNIGMHKILKSETGEVETITIDSLGLEGLDLLHLDIEGHESFALKGAVETIKKYRPVVITEVGHGSEVLESLGYRRYKKLRMDTIFLPEEFA